MKIEIPENTKAFGTGATCMHPLCYMQRYLDIAARNIRTEYKETYPISDLKAFELGSWVRVISNLKSFVTLCLIGEDYNSCCTLARSIADSICALKLIYQSQDRIETEFRHYLYVLDGISERFKMLPKNITNNGRITDDEFIALKKQCEEAKQNSMGAIQFCTKKLRDHPYYHLYPKFVEKAIASKKIPWKFIQVGKMQKGKIEEYTWKHMYSLLDSRESVITMYSGYLSQFVHGLSISCIAPLYDADNFDSIACAGVCLQGLVKQRLSSIVNTEVFSKGATIDDFAYLLSLYSPEKGQKILDGAKAILNIDGAS